ncbi:hypothetical protein QOZ80_7AG0560600 [Eleusine coracana subsp. coracana]|nr:hypothetical protein QOZ80_7AG0560600 [Eleusine coracana subsp. coracana]
MAEALLVVVSKIGSTLTEEATIAAISKLSEKVKNLKELPGKIEDIRSELIMMNYAVKQISTPSPTDVVVKGWIAEVRILAHRVEDVIDKYSYHSLKLEEENAVKKIFSKPYYVAVFSDIAEEISKIEKKIENVAKRKERWLQPSQLGANPLADIERKKSQDCLLDVVPDDIVGIEENRILLTQWLYSKEQSGIVITVSGMGGLGKTTLVGNVYEREKNNFTAHAWIVVSQTYNVVELLRKLLRKIGGLEQTHLANMDAHDLKEKIKLRLKDSKCLIVFDDVWNHEAYTQISYAFRNFHQCCVIITTRQENVASLADPTRQLKLKPLEHNDAFALFCRKAFYNSSGCSLVRLWVAEGFSVQTQQSTSEEVADNYLRELIQRNMIEVVDQDELGRVSTCKMHDLVRELALSVAKEEKFGFATDFGTMVKMDKSIRRLSSCGWKDKTSPKDKIELPRLRTLVAVGINASPHLLSSVLSESVYLTAIELQDSELTEVPTSIGNLFNLRYIGLRRTNIKSLPESIGKLSNLHTLDIKQTKIEKLPRGIAKIKKLRHLLADRYADEKQSEFRLLLSASDKNEALCLEALKPESENLHRLIIRGCWADKTLDCPIFHDHGKNLKYLALSWCNLCGDPLQLLAPHVPNLTYLRLNRVSSARTLVLSAGCFPHLKTLELKNMNDVNNLEIRDGALPQIEGLYVVTLPNLNKIPQGLESLRSLKKLWLLYLHQDFTSQWNRYGMQQKMQYVPELHI